MPQVLSAPLSGCGYLNRNARELARRNRAAPLAPLFWSLPVDRYRLVARGGSWRRYWDHDGHPEGQLLRSGAITAVRSWAGRRPGRNHLRGLTARAWDVIGPPSCRRTPSSARWRSLVGEGRLRNDELRILRLLLGEVKPDVVSRWFGPSPRFGAGGRDRATLAEWRRHHEIPLAVARKDWAARAADSNADLAKVRADRDSTKARNLPNPSDALAKKVETVPDRRWLVSRSCLPFLS
jgi:hypothetical protein